MANIGVLYGNQTHNIRLEFHWAQRNPSTINNQSEIAWDLKCVSRARIAFSAPKSWSCTVNGQPYSGTYSAGMNGTGTADSPIVAVLASGVTPVDHNSDGSKTFSVSATFGIKITITTTGEFLDSITLSDSDELDKIARISSLVTNNGALGTEQILTVSRQDSSFTHTITYSCGSTSGTIVNESTSESISWTPPLDLAAQNTTGTSVSIIFTISTYTDNTLLGSSQKTITCAIPSSVKPSLSMTVSDGNGYQSTYGGYVQGRSTISISLIASGNYGATIKSYNTSADGSKYSTSSFITPVIKNSGILTISATVTDSRGRSSTVSEDITVLAYSPATVTALKSFRCTSDGTPSSSGTYLKVVFSANVTSLHSKNTATYKLHYRKTTVSTFTSTVLSSYSNNYSITDGYTIFSADTSSAYVIRVSATDAFSGRVAETNGPATTKVFSIFTKGLGFAVGKIAELSEYFDVGWNARFRKNVTIDGNLDAKVKQLSNYYDSAPTSADIAPDGSGGLKKFLATSSMTTNTPPSLGHIIHCNWSSTSGYDAQLALNYGSTPGAHVRSQLNGTWSAWRTLVDDISLKTNGVPAYNYGQESTSSAIRYFKVASATLGTTYSNAVLILYVVSPHGNYGSGILQVFLRRNNTTTLTTELSWLVKDGDLPDDAAILVNDDGASTSALYFKTTTNYVRYHCHVLVNTDRTKVNVYPWTMYSDNTALTSLPSGTNYIPTNNMSISGALTTSAVEISNSTPFIDFHFNNSTTDYTARIIESSSGVLKAYNSIANASDERLKKEFDDPFGEQLDRYLELYDRLEPMLYRYISGDDFLNIGLIAQEVLALESELGIENSLLVRGTGKEIEVNGKKEIDYYAIDYTAISMLGLIKNRQMNEICNELIENHLELSEKYDDLANRVSLLENT